MQRPFFSQSPKRVGSGPTRPPISRGRATEVAGVAADAALASGTRCSAAGADVQGAEMVPAGIDIPDKSARICLGQPRAACGQSTANSMRSDLSMVSLDKLGVLRVRGADAVAFLQGQLSNDLQRLAVDRSLLAGYHSPQGRVIALLRVLQLAPDDLLAVLPRELIAKVVARLTKFILRAKVRLVDDSQQWRVSGLLAGGAEHVDGGDTNAATSDSEVVAALPAAEDAAAHIAAAIAVRVTQQPARWLLIAPASQAPLTLGSTARENWQRSAIAAGEPQVYAATSEEFVAQMLNLDAIGVIAFDKGCYTGQEVIARTHYRGRVKRRMQHFVTRGPHALQPGDAGELGDGRAFRVVDAVSLADGRCEFLAVAPLEPGSTDAEGAAAAGAAAAGVGSLGVQALPLPYPLPA
jgi:folate-binding protein YgfZ